MVVVVSLRKENNCIVIGLCVEMVYGVDRGSGGYAQDAIIMMTRNYVICI